ncbi:hypothetical protein F5Y15DRAFT_424480 [Xylariaceae sp. FL0016]|nr:hypothetical protein F5Y15DRAFT_424480 [Xylariaceae sp. FL0016]
MPVNERKRASLASSIETLGDDVEGLSISPLQEVTSNDEILNQESAEPMNPMLETGRRTTTDPKASTSAAPSLQRDTAFDEYCQKKLAEKANPPREAPYIAPYMQNVGVKSLASKPRVPVHCTTCSCGEFDDSGITLLDYEAMHTVLGLGSQYVLTQRPAQFPGYQVQTLRYLSFFTRTPVPEFVMEWREKDGRQFVMTTAIEGESLYKVWHDLTDEDRQRIATQVAKEITEIRYFTADRTLTVFGHNRRFFCGQWFDSDEELWDILEKQKSDVDGETAGDRRHEAMPVCKPYTLTHGELRSSHIIVKDANLAGIIGWESAGFMPQWVESAALSMSGGEECEKEWRKLLVAKLS